MIKMDQQHTGISYCSMNAATSPKATFNLLHTQVLRVLLQVLPQFDEQSF